MIASKKKKLEFKNLYYIHTVVAFVFGMYFMAIACAKWVCLHRFRLYVVMVTSRYSRRRYSFRRRYSYALPPHTSTKSSWPSYSQI